jgi:hypothetical protein
LEKKKIAPKLGSYVTILFLTDNLLLQSFSGVCSSILWSGKSTTFTLVNPSSAFTLKMFLFSPLLLHMDLWYPKIKNKRKKG